MNNIKKELKNSRIALIGMMGSGKTTVSFELSSILNIENFDLDKIFVQKYNTSIVDFFDKFGEEKFRSEETNILKETLKKDKFILSCGGGIILQEENRKILFSKDIFSIYLKTSACVIYDRIKEDKTRPLLLVQNPKKEIEKLIQKRKKYYEAANLIIQTDNKNPREIAKEIYENI
ncbi:shikimate kinase [bacterium]|nr:shikimate kinase [bacterium]